MLTVNLVKIDSCENCIDEFCLKKFGKLPKVTKKTRVVFTCQWCFYQGYTVLAVEL